MKKFITTMTVLALSASVLKRMREKRRMGGEYGLVLRRSTGGDWIRKLKLQLWNTARMPMWMASMWPLTIFTTWRI